MEEEQREDEPCDCTVCRTLGPMPKVTCEEALAACLRLGGGAYDVLLIAKEAGADEGATLLLAATVGDLRTLHAFLSAEVRNLTEMVNAKARGIAGAMPPELRNLLETIADRSEGGYVFRIRPVRAGEKGGPSIN